MVTGVTQSQVLSIQDVLKPWKSNRMKDVPVDTQRQMPTMQKVKNTKVENRVKTSQVQNVDEIVKDPSDHAEASSDDAEDAERTKGTPGYRLYIDRPCPQESPSAGRSTWRRECADKEKTHGELSRAAPEETVPEEIDSMKAPPDTQTGRHMSESSSARWPRGTKPGQSQREEKRCWKEGAQRRPQDAYAEFKKRGDARVQCKRGTSE